MLNCLADETSILNYVRQASVGRNQERLSLAATGSYSTVEVAPSEVEDGDALRSGILFGQGHE